MSELPELPPAAIAWADQADMYSRSMLDGIIDACRQDIAGNNGVPPLPASLLGYMIYDQMPPYEASLLLGEAILRLALSDTVAE